MGIAGINGTVGAWNPTPKMNTQKNNTGFDGQLVSKVVEDLDVATEQNSTSVQDIYEKEKANMTVHYKGKPINEWSDGTKYTDKETGISWYVCDGKYPYMTGEDAEKFNKLCDETGENRAKKFAEMTGFIRQLDNNTMVYVGDNGLDVEGKDGRELFVDTSKLSYAEVMRLLDNLQTTNDYFDSNYWNRHIAQY